MAETELHAPGCPALDGVGPCRCWGMCELQFAPPAQSDGVVTDE